MLRLLTADLQLDSVLELDATRVHALGLDALLLDVDCTLKNYRAEDVGEDVAAWLGSLRAAGIGLCLVSNGRNRRIMEFAQRRRLPFVAKALKPLPFGCRAAVRKLSLDPRRTAMVGDQVFADVVAGRLAGLFCILVKPIRPEEEPWYTRLKRLFEKPFRRR